MQKLLGQLMNCCIDVDSSEEEDYEQVSRNRVRCSMTSLISWYESATKVRSLCVTSLQKRLTFIFFKRRKLNTSNSSSEKMQVSFSSNAEKQLRLSRFKYKSVTYVTDAEFIADEV